MFSHPICTDLNHTFLLKDKPMKKSLLALAVLSAFTGIAYAQTSITVYGIVDAGIVSERGGPAGTVTKLTSGVQSGSRLGFRGTEDLGRGLAAKFVLETGIAIDTGGFNQNGTAFGRQAYVGLSGGWGAVTLGRQYTPHYLAVVDVDPFAAGLAGYAPNLVTTVLRMNNTIKYTTPAWSGFIGELGYGFGEVPGNNTANRQIGAAVGYANGPLVAKLAYHTVDDAIGADRARNTLLMGKWDFGVAAASLGVNVNKGIGAIDNRDYIVGLSAPIGQNTFLASYIRKDDRSGLNNDASQWALGYTYAISKRTNFYTSYARINNDNGAAFTVGNASEAGSGDKAFNVGIRHMF
jgi:predicted porin